MQRKSLTAAALLALCAAPAALAAQRGPVSLGAGPGITQSDELTGAAAHLRVSAPLARVGERLSIHAEAMAQQGTISGDPSTCAMVRPEDCTGRSDRNRLFGAGAFLRWDVGPQDGAVRAYVVPVGAAVFHRRTASEEQQAPTGICVVDGQLAPCPDAAPFARLSSADERTSLGLAVGAGVEADVLGMRLFADLRVHRLTEGRDSWAGAAPLTLGVVL